jgi:ABC-type multidrug transport system fused ATPase/permease subunit
VPPASKWTPGVIKRGLWIITIAIREEPLTFIGAVAGSALFGVATVGSSYVLGKVTDRVLIPALATGETTAAALAFASLAIVAVGIARAVGMFIRRLVAGLMVYRQQATYRRRVTRQYLRLPLSWHHRHSTGALLSNANADVEASWSPIAPLPFAVGVLVMLVAALVLLVATDPLLAAVGCVVFPAFGVINVLYGRRVSPLLARAQQLRAEVSGVAHESFDGALVVKTLGREAHETERFAVKSGELRDTMVRAGRVRGVFDPAMEALPNLGVLVVLIVGVLRIDAGVLAVGDLVRVAYLFTLLAFPIRAIGWMFGELPRSVVGYGRVEAVLGAQGEQRYGRESIPGSGPAAVSVEGVSYTYPRPNESDAAFRSGTASPGTGGSGITIPPVDAGHGRATQGGSQLRQLRPAVADVTFDIAPGRMVAVTGRTGSGKSTLADLLARLIDPDHGTVRIDGVDLTEAAPGEVSSTVALVAQQSFLFDDTVRANVTLGRPYGDDQVWDALRWAQAEAFVAALPDGIGTHVGERGFSLSGGQRQRIALARALVRSPRLLVLDDATSSVDPHVEASILAGLREGAGEATMIVIAYRRAAIALADDVLFLDAGRIAARGTHTDLLLGSPPYAALLTAYEEMAGTRGVFGSNGLAGTRLVRARGVSE